MTGILGLIKYMAFERQVRQMLCVDRTIYIYTSPYFRSRQTLGFPSALCLCPDIGKAWLVPAEKKLSDIRYRSMKSSILCAIADFGIKDCRSADDLIGILQELGADRVKYTDRCDEWHYMFEYDRRR